MECASVDCEAAMGSGGGSASVGLFLALNLLLFTLAAEGATCPPKMRPKPTPKTKPTPSPSPSSAGKCPIDTLKLASCTNVLNGLIVLGIGSFPKQPCDCCTLIEGMLDFEAAVCLCTALRANILGVNLNVPINLSLLVNYCGKKVPSEFQCP